MKALATLAGAVVLSATPVMTDLDFEPNNDFAHAGQVKMPLMNGTGCIDTARDVDFYTFTLTEPSPLFISAKAQGGAQFRLTLYDAKEGVLKKTTDMVDLTAVDAGTYYLQVAGLEKDCYDLQIFAETRLPPYG